MNTNQTHRRVVRRRQGQQPLLKVKYVYFCPHTECNWAWTVVTPGSTTCGCGHGLRWVRTTNPKYGEEWQVQLLQHTGFVRLHGEVELWTLKAPKSGSELGRKLQDGEQVSIRGEAVDGYLLIGDGQWLHSYFVDFE